MGTGGTLLGASLLAGHVTLDGGSTTLLSLLNDGGGVHTTDEILAEPAGERGHHARLVAQQRRRGAHGGPGRDFRIILTDGTPIDVTLTLTATTTLQALFDQITAAANAVAPGRLVVALDPASGDAITLQDTRDGGNPIQVAALNGSPAAADLGLLGTGARGRPHRRGHHGRQP